MKRALKLSVLIVAALSVQAIKPMTGTRIEQLKGEFGTLVQNYEKKNKPVSEGDHTTFQTAAKAIITKLRALKADAVVIQFEKQLTDIDAARKQVAEAGDFEKVLIKVVQTLADNFDREFLSKPRTKDSIQAGAQFDKYTQLIDGAKRKLGDTYTQGKIAKGEYERFGKNIEEIYVQIGKTQQSYLIEAMKFITGQYDELTDLILAQEKNSTANVWVDMLAKPGPVEIKEVLAAGIARSKGTYQKAAALKNSPETQALEAAAKKLSQAMRNMLGAKTGYLKKETIDRNWQLSLARFNLEGVVEREIKLLSQTFSIDATILSQISLMTATNKSILQDLETGKPLQPTGIVQPIKIVAQPSPQSTPTSGQPKTSAMPAEFQTLEAHIKKLDDLSTAFKQLSGSEVTSAKVVLDLQGINSVAKQIVDVMSSKAIENYLKTIPDDYDRLVGGIIVAGNMMRNSVIQGRIFSERLIGQPGQNAQTVKDTALVLVATARAFLEKCFALAGNLNNQDFYDRLVAMEKNLLEENKELETKATGSTPIMSSTTTSTTSTAAVTKIPVGKLSDRVKTLVPAVALAEKKALDLLMEYSAKLNELIKKSGTQGEIDYLQYIKVILTNINDKQTGVDFVNLGSLLKKLDAEYMKKKQASASTSADVNKVLGEVLEEMRTMLFFVYIGVKDGLTYYEHMLSSKLTGYNAVKKSLEDVLASVSPLVGSCVEITTNLATKADFDDIVYIEKFVSEFEGYKKNLVTLTQPTETKSTAPADITNFEELIGRLEPMVGNLTVLASDSPGDVVVKNIVAISDKIKNTWSEFSTVTDNSNRTVLDKYASYLSSLSLSEQQGFLNKLDAVWSLSLKAAEAMKELYSKNTKLDVTQKIDLKTPINNFISTLGFFMEDYAKMLLRVNTNESKGKSIQVKAALEHQKKSGVLQELKALVQK